MRTQVSARVKGSEKGSSNGQKAAIYDLKQRVVLSLNRLADRDTYQIGLGELEKTIECLTHDTVVPFMSCILDTDSDQKSAVRKECIRLVGVLVTLHDGLIVPYIGKIVASIVKRLKDSDSIVRDACIETMGVLGSKLSNEEGENEDLFVALVKPLFEALGEQNKYMQSGAALCLARVIDYFNYPSVSILQRMMTRTTQFLKNQHFMAKPAAVELTRSIIQAGGTPTKKALSIAIGSIQEALKNSDWNTRKAASLALLELASTGGPSIGSLKASCIRSLELCRFDKVKPVRDTILQSLNVWRSLPGPDTPEPSEAGSSIKENFCGGGDVFSSATNGYEWKGSPLAKAVTDSTKKMSPLSARKPRQSNLNNCQNPKEAEWRVEISVPKTHNFLVSDINNEESEGSSITKSFGTISTDIKSCLENDHRYVPMVDRQEYSSASSLLTGNSKTKHVEVSKARHEGGLKRSVKVDHMFANDEIDTEEERYPINSQDRRSTDSAVDSSAVDSSSPNADRCFLKATKEMDSIRKQLLEIESKQSDLMDMLKVFTANTTNSLSTIQSKVSCLEQVVDTIAQEVINGGKYGNFLKIGSPSLNKSTPRPSIDIRDRQPCVKNTFSRSKLSESRKQETDIWTDPTIGKPNKGNVTVRYNQIKTNDSNIGSHKNNLQKGHIFERELESAYVEGLNLGDEHFLFELVRKTGPVLDRLSRKTALDVLNILGSYFLEQKFINSVIPWLQQVVELSNIRGQNYLVPSAKTKQAFLLAMKEAAGNNFTNSAERRFIMQLAFELHQIWGEL
ncbi:TORTIFOLIA1-like protein 2 [Impatiens glandulifera]|uniref:TORTIFOLIA1-like protein 2 n=1 Tax=Impatiens glandulifera TaxID=253017 RepID=UPI001FB106EE|nr:TORTIFOLIA1-like protein 2 [Impatiens glandulifera]XP_047329688.1 TORTIFOLIA1-like protein 2 [Impatiens glandulifera]